MCVCVRACVVWCECATRSVVCGVSPDVVVVVVADNNDDADTTTVCCRTRCKLWYTRSAPFPMRLFYIYMFEHSFGLCGYSATCFKHARFADPHP